MGALRKIWRAIFDDNGAPSLYAGLVLGAPSPDRQAPTSERRASRSETPNPPRQN